MAGEERSLRLDHTTGTRSILARRVVFIEKINKETATRRCVSSVRQSANTTDKRNEQITFSSRDVSAEVGALVTEDDERCSFDNDPTMVVLSRRNCANVISCFDEQHAANMRRHGVVLDKTIAADLCEKLIHRPRNTATEPCSKRVIQRCRKQGTAVHDADVTRSS